MQSNQVRLEAHTAPVGALRVTEGEQARQGLLFVITVQVSWLVLSTVSERALALSRGQYQALLKVSIKRHHIGKPASLKLTCGADLKGREGDRVSGKQLGGRAISWKSLSS